ncbi:hypothetical protein Acr_06g0000530 [Actinidia rufa]|uniref:Uncharacterized protein n=1 Tax=Actinidia rufa TaxID=165716 RepID=A0A7J0ENP2_9ERIC|nr:hypothetical protein Acr_06g0000530 [Actinidia rufa]
MSMDILTSNQSSSVDSQSIQPDGQKVAKEEGDRIQLDEESTTIDEEVVDVNEDVEEVGDKEATQDEIVELDVEIYKKANMKEEIKANRDGIVENQVAKSSTHGEEKETEDRIESPQYATSTVCKLDGYAIIVDDSTNFKMELGQKNLQNQHETYFVDFVERYLVISCIPLRQWHSPILLSSIIFLIQDTCANRSLQRRRAMLRKSGCRLVLMVGGMLCLSVFLQGMASRVSFR